MIDINELTWPEPYASIEVDAVKGLSIVDKPSYKTVELYTRHQVEQMLLSAQSSKAKINS